MKEETTLFDRILSEAKELQKVFTQQIMNADKELGFIRSKTSVKICDELARTCGVQTGDVVDAVCKLLRDKNK